MQTLRPASLFLSLCLHAGVVVLVFFLPQSAPPPIDITAPIIDVSIYTLGKPGAALRSDMPESPKTPATPSAPPKAPETPQDAPAPKPDPAKPEPTPVKPETPPIPIAQPPEQPKPEAPKVEPPKPEPPKPEPPKPEPPTVAPPKPGDSKPEPTKPAQPTKPAPREKPSPSADDLLRAALGDLKGKTPDPDSSDPGGDGPGGSGGDGIGIVGSYMQSLVSRIKPNWEYAGRADRRNPTATVAISIGKDGTILQVDLVESSGDAAFDGSVLKAVHDTIRVEPPPTPDLMRVRVPFAYDAIRR